MAPKLAALAAKSLMLAERLVAHEPSCDPPCASVLFFEYMLPLGCCVHLSPVFEAIRHARPDVTISVATLGLGAELLRHNGSVDHLIVTPDPIRSLGSASRSLRRELASRALNPDCFLTGASDRRTRIALMALLAKAGICRGGFTLAEGLYQRPLQYDTKRSLIDNNLELLRLLGSSPRHFEPRVFFSPNDVESIQRLVHNDSDRRPVVVLVTQNSGGQRTGWHLERFVSVTRHAEDVLGLRTVFVGTAKEASSIEQIRHDAGGRGMSLAGRTSVTQLAALLAMSDYVVSLDTGTMHIGRAVESPMVVLGPSWQRPIEWLPLASPQVRILRGPDVEKAPPGYRLDEISADQVSAALAELTQLYPATPEARERRIQRSLSTVDHLAKMH